MILSRDDRDKWIIGYLARYGTNISGIDTLSSHFVTEYVIATQGDVPYDFDYRRAPQALKRDLLRLYRAGDLDRHVRTIDAHLRWQYGYPAWVWHYFLPDHQRRTIHCARDKPTVDLDPKSAAVSTSLDTIKGVTADKAHPVVGSIRHVCEDGAVLVLNPNDPLYDRMLTCAQAYFDGDVWVDLRSESVVV